MRLHTLQRTLFLPLAKEEVFPFFADAGNLGRITPPEVRFRFLTPLPIEMQVGTLIDYVLRLHRVPIRWRTRITAWEPPDRFVDEQVRGPYGQWVHSHEFRSVTGGTEMCDHVVWSLPLPPFGELAFPWVRRELAHIFEYRERAIRSILLGEKADS